MELFRNSGTPVCYCTLINSKHFICDISGDREKRFMTPYKALLQKFKSHCSFFFLDITENLLNF
jgi:hypothetical protein